MKIFTRKCTKLTALAGLGLSFLLVSGCCEDGVRTESQTLEKEEWIGALSATFDGVSLRLNNYTPNDHEFSAEDVSAFYKPDDSYLRVDALDLDIAFDIPLQRQNPYSIYINDVNSTSFEPDARSRKGLITIFFEEGGTEIVGNCVDNIACICGDPRINLNDMKIEVWLSVGAAGGRLTISDIAAELSSTYEETGPCVDNVCAFACDLFAADRESQMREAIEEQVVNHFNSYRGIIEGLFNDHLESLGVSGEITSASIGTEGELLLIVQSDDPSC